MPIHFGFSRMTFLVALFSLMFTMFGTEKLSAAPFSPDITSFGSSVFTGAEGAATTTHAYKSSDYLMHRTPYDEVTNGSPWDPSEGVMQLQWGYSPSEEFFVPISAYSLENYETDVVLGEVFTVSALTHYNQKIIGDNIEMFYIQVSIILSIDGVTLPAFVYDELRVRHLETLNPADDVVQWLNLQETRVFFYGDAKYELTMHGFDIPKEPIPLCQIATRCFTTPESDNPFDPSYTMAPVLASLNATLLIPEPSTYLLMGSLVGLVIALKVIRSRRKSSNLSK